MSERPWFPLYRRLLSEIPPEREDMRAEMRAYYDRLLERYGKDAEILREALAREAAFDDLTNSKVVSPGLRRSVDALEQEKGGYK